MNDTADASPREFESLSSAEAARRLSADGPNELPGQGPRSLAGIVREVLTVFLAMGAWRISRVGVLTRRMPALESIGAATILAVDKTGTLAEFEADPESDDVMQRPPARATSRCFPTTCSSEAWVSASA